MIYLTYILLSSLLCVWITNERNTLHVIVYLCIFYALVMKIVIGKEAFTTDIGQNFVIGIIGVLMIYLNYKNKKE